MSLRLSDPPMSRRTRTFLRRWKRGSFQQFLERQSLPPGGPCALLDPKEQVLARLRGSGPIEELKKLGSISFGTPPYATLVGDIATIPESFLAWLRLLLQTIESCKEEVDSLSDHALERHRELNLLYGFTEQSSSILTLEDLLQLVLNTAVRAVVAAGASIQVLAAGHDEQPHKMTVGVVPTVGKRVIDEVLSEGVPMVGMFPESLRVEHGERWSGTLVCLPLRTAGRNIGTLLVAAGEGRMLEASDQRILTALATLAATRIEQTKLQAEAARKRELAVVGHMASAIVHDFKNPLTAIRGFAEMIAIGAAAPEEYAELASQVVNNADKLWSMVDELLHFVRGSSDSLQLTRVTGPEFARQMKQVLEHSVPSCIELKIDLDPIDEMWIDRNRFERVIGNLVRNAVEAIIGKGKVQVTGEACAQRDDCWRIIVEDDGPGIDKQSQKHIWEPFFTTGKANGTGLGLAIVKKIVTDHGGTVTLHSQLGRGTRFVIEIPKRPPRGTAS